MTTNIVDRYGRPAPKVTTTALRRRPGRFWNLVDRRGAVIISQGDGADGVALSLDYFVSLLFGLPGHTPRQKRKSRAKKRGKR